MFYLPDTNIVLRFVNDKDPFHQTIVDSIEILENSGEEFIMIPQILTEFWAVQPVRKMSTVWECQQKNAKCNWIDCKNFSGFCPKTKKFSRVGKNLS